MKLYIKRDTVCGNAGFLVTDELGHQKYAVTAECGAGIRLTMMDKNGDTCGVIKYNEFMLSYFTISCCRRFYVLIPVSGEYTGFNIYGSTYRFSGNAADGCFSILTSGGECAMTHKKTWGPAGEAFELIITDEDHELFLLSCALCADMTVYLDKKSLAPSG